MQTVAEYLAATGESVDALAERAGIAPSTIYRLKDRKFFPRSTTRRRLFEASGGKITRYEQPADEFVGERAA